MAERDVWHAGDVGDRSDGFKSQPLTLRQPRIEDLPLVAQNILTFSCERRPNSIIPNLSCKRASLGPRATSFSATIDHWGSRSDRPAGSVGSQDFTAPLAGGYRRGSPGYRAIPRSPSVQVRAIGRMDLRSITRGSCLWAPAQEVHRQNFEWHAQHRRRAAEPCSSSPIARDRRAGRPCRVPGLSCADANKWERLRLMR